MGSVYHPVQRSFHTGDYAKSHGAHAREPCFISYVQLVRAGFTLRRTREAQEHDEFVKHQKLEAINGRLAQHGQKMQVILLLVVALNVVILALVTYQLLGRE